jgi:hypothetical protein
LVHPLGKGAPELQKLRDALVSAGWNTLAVDLRDTGETFWKAEYIHGNYLAVRDGLAHRASIWVGRPLLGQWTWDVRRAVDYVIRREDVDASHVAVIGFGDTGLAGLIEAGQDPRVDATVLDESLASFVSSNGFGTLWHKWVDDPCGPMRNVAAFVPDLFSKVADWPELAAFVCPRRLLIVNPEGGDKKPLSDEDAAHTFAWTRSVYEAYRSPSNFSVKTGVGEDEIINWLRVTQEQPHAQVHPNPIDDVPLPADLPSLPEYCCHKVKQPPRMDGSLDDVAWNEAEQTSLFVDISTGRTPPLQTWAKMVWDDEALYIAFWIADRNVEAKVLKNDGPVYNDNDIEVFLDPDGDGRQYMDLEMNANAAVFDALVDRPGGGSYVDWNLRGLQSAVRVEKASSWFGQKTKGWVAELKMPWDGLVDVRGSAPCPPRPGDVWRVNFARGEWNADHEHEDFWVWSVHGRNRMHIPERFGKLRFQ